MNKEKFLEELKEYIQILEEQEQEDILEEYAQHIDMKLQKGLSEEEAIQDFGPMKVLAAEILEAYHVKPEFGQRKKMRLFSVQGKEASETSGNILVRIGRWLKEKSGAALRSTRSGFRWIGGKCRTFSGWLGKPFQRRKTESIYALGDEIMEGMYEDGRCTSGGSVNGQYTDSQYSGELAEASSETMAGSVSAEAGLVWQKTTGRSVVHSRKKRNAVGRMTGAFFRMIGRGCAKLWQMFLLCAVFCLRLFWNMVWLLFSILCGMLTMIVLAGFGALLILFFQNYPLGGILLISLGSVMCFGALSCFAFSLLIRKKRKGQKTEISKDDVDKADREVQYE